MNSTNGGSMDKDDTELDKKDLGKLGKKWVKSLLDLELNKLERL
jgi:hypothetical protein